jgi:hypothetical protein
MTESLVDDDTVRFVFDWISSQGNGTFQSVGWFKPGVPGIPMLPSGYGHRGTATTATLTPSSHITGATSLSQGGGWYDSSSGKFYFIVRRQATSGAMRVVSVPMSSFLDDSTSDILGVSTPITGLAVTNESDEFTPTSSTTLQSAAAHMLGIDSGGNRIFAYYQGSSVWRWGKIPALGANTSYAAPGASPFTDMPGCVIGTTVYLASQSDSSIYACSTTTGSTTATLTIDATVTALCTLAGITTPRPYEVITDGTDLIVTYSQSGTSSYWLTVRLNTSGVLQETYGIAGGPYQSAGFVTETAGPPYAGVYYYGSNNWESNLPAYVLSQDMAGAQHTSETALTLPTYTDQLTWGTNYNRTMGNSGIAAGFRQMIYADGALYWIGAGPILGANALVTSFYWQAFRLGFNLGSRVKLGSPLVKASTDTMKITYDITMPGWF